MKREITVTGGKWGTLGFRVRRRDVSEIFEPLKDQLTAGLSIELPGRTRPRARQHDKNLLDDLPIV